LRIRLFAENRRLILGHPCPHKYELIERLSTRADLTAMLSTRLYSLYEKDGFNADAESLKLDIAAGHMEWDAINAELGGHREEHGC
jgi:hypothetical protein